MTSENCFHFSNYEQRFIAQKLVNTFTITTKWQVNGYLLNYPIDMHLVDGRGQPNLVHLYHNVLDLAAV